MRFHNFEFRIGITLVVGEDTNNGSWVGIPVVGGENSIQRHLGFGIPLTVSRSHGLTSAAGFWVLKKKEE